MTGPTAERLRTPPITFPHPRPSLARDVRGRGTATRTVPGRDARSTVLRRHERSSRRSGAASETTPALVNVETPASHLEVRLDRCDRMARVRDDCQRMAR